MRRIGDFLRRVFREVLGHVLALLRQFWVTRIPSAIRALLKSAGLESARARGRHGGRPRALDEGEGKFTSRLKGEGEHSVEEICSMRGAGSTTLHRYLTETDGGGY